MGKQFFIGDIFSPNRTGHEIIVCHQVNCRGVMGAGLAKQIRDRFPIAYTMYQRECRSVSQSADLLGKVLFIPVQYHGFDFTIANIFSQDGYGRDRCYTDYEALREAFRPIRTMAEPLPARALTTVRIPYKMGCGLAGGSWEIVEKIIDEELVDKGIPVQIWSKSDAKIGEQCNGTIAICGARENPLGYTKETRK